MSKNDGHQQHIPSYLIENPWALIHSTSQCRYHFHQNIQAPDIATHQKNKMITAWNVKSNQTKSSIPKCHESSYIKAHGPPPQAKCSFILARMQYNDAKKNMYTQTRVFVPQYAVPNKTFMKMQKRSMSTASRQLVFKLKFHNTIHISTGIEWVEIWTSRQLTI